MSYHLIVRRRPYGVEYLDDDDRWTVYKDQACYFVDYSIASRVASRHEAIVVSPSFAAVWAEVATRDLIHA